MSSQLDRMIARLTTQRVCLDHAAALIASLPGAVLELGLGKGRTWSHLTSLFPERPVFAFDHSLHAPADLTPPADRLILGDLRETLPGPDARFGGPVALIHADIGTADGQGELGESDAELARFVGAASATLLAPGGILAGDRDMNPDSSAAFERLDLPAITLPAGVPPWPYHLLCRC